MPKEVMDVLIAPDTVKMLATVDEKGTPNVASVGSIIPVDPETIAFAEIFMKRTKENLEKNRKAAITVFKAPLVAYQLKGTFAGSQKSGPVFDNFAKKMSERKLQVKSVGIIKVDEVFAASPGADSKKLA